MMLMYGHGLGAVCPHQQLGEMFRNPNVGIHGLENFTFRNIWLCQLMVADRYRVVDRTETSPC